MLKHGAILLTHIEDERIFRSFRRLQQQAGRWLDLNLCVNDRAAPYRSKLSGSNDHDARDVMPARVQEMIARGSGLIPGFCDLAFVPAAISPALAAYDYVWFIEYDVDFAGDWDTLFAALHDSRADLLTTTLYPKADCPDWVHWSWLQTPPGLRDDQLIRCFAPIARFSRRPFAGLCGSRQFTGLARPSRSALPGHRNTFGSGDRRHRRAGTFRAARAANASLYQQARELRRTGAGNIRFPAGATIFILPRGAGRVYVARPPLSSD
jgi:hypothetical protein